MRRHEDPGRYVDSRAFEEYAAHRGQELVASELVVGSPSAVFDAWLKEIWLARGTELQSGLGRGCVGSVRSTALGVEEEIVSAGLPAGSKEKTLNGQASRAGLGIPTISYKVRKFGLFPMQNHLALVRFVDLAASPESAPATLVVWSVKTEPSALGYLCCCGVMARVVLRVALQSFLSALAASASARSSSRLKYGT